MSTDLELQVQRSLEKVPVEFSQEAIKNAELNNIEKKKLPPTLKSKPIRIGTNCIFICFKNTTIEPRLSGTESFMKLLFLKHKRIEI